MDTPVEEGDDDLSEKVKKALISGLTSTTNNFERAHLIRQSGFVLFQESLKNKCEDLASAYLEEVLDAYGKVVTSVGPSSVNNYTDRVVELLRKSQRPVDLKSWKSSLNFEETNIEGIRNECAGEYEDCKYKEITDEDVEQFCKIFKNNSPKRKREESSIPKNLNLDATVSSTVDFVEKVEPRLPINAAACHPAPVRDYAPRRSIAPQIPKEEVHQPRKTSIVYAKKLANDSEMEDMDAPNPNNDFRTARDELTVQNFRKYGNRGNVASSSSNFPDMRQHHQQSSSNSMASKIPSVPEGPPQQTPLFSYGATKKSLGARRTVLSKFVPPVKSDADEATTSRQANDVTDERLKHIDPKMIELISSEIMTKFKPVCWDDIAGLHYAKTTIQEAVVWPILRPDIFTGLRRPPRGILLFGPPGTGKTLIGKCIASQSKSTFFSISASSLTSKWIGDGEKMVRALFAVAAVHQPAVIFIDEVDSLLCQRSESEHESTRRFKTEFLVQLDGAVTSEEERILIVGATNRPQELDEAARRRFIRRLYIPLPEKDARLQILKNLLRSVRHSLNESDIDRVGELARGYSGADMESLCREASMEPIRSIPPDQILHFDENEVRPISVDDFQKALNRIRASVSQQDLKQYVQWDQVYGSGTSQI